uniref:Cathepsin L-like cysteine proteinase n=1 Tax=Radopholus similis TaxID=46012 RepID=B5LBI0_RADSI|nr:cathepsin L-like cysteine proteinase [Radopholus similis]
MDSIFGKQRILSLSWEPLLLDAPYWDWTVAEEQKIARQNRSKVLSTLMLAMLDMTTGAMFLHCLPGLVSLQLRFWRCEQTPLVHFFPEELPEVVREFDQIQRTFSREWNSERERWERFKLFERNLAEIARLNAEAKRTGRNMTYGVNGMADWTEEEMGRMLLPLDHFKRRRVEAKFIRKMNPILRRAFTDRSAEEPGSEYPRHFDWRPRGVVTPVKAQGQCGSCWAFAAVATTESAYAVAHGHLRSLSEQELLDCNLENNACNGGSEDKAFRYIHERGLVTEDEYPYVAHRQNVCSVDFGSKNLTKIDVAVFINPDEQSMMDWLINFGPVNVGIAVPPDMKPYKSGIYHPSDYDCKFRVLGLHALLVVGYGESQEGVKYWIVKNSWNNTWGQEHGYVNFVRGINACGIEDEPIGLLA